MSSKRRLRRSGCESKRAYPSAEKASRAIVALVGAKGTWEGWRPYKCKWCGQWHFGRPPAKFNKAKDDA